jgi:hypothetical protein
MRKDFAFAMGAAVFAVTLAVCFWIQAQKGAKLFAETGQQVAELKPARNQDSTRLDSSDTAHPNVNVTPAPTSSVAAQGVTGIAGAPASVAASNCESLLAQVKRSASLATADMAAEIKLTPAEFQTIAKLRETQMTSASHCGGLPVSEEQLQAQLQATLGPERFEQLQEFNTTRITNQNVATLRRQLAARGAPLDDEQIRQLTTTMLDEYRQSRREASWSIPPSQPDDRLAYEKENLKISERRVERLLKTTGSFLRTEQLEQLRTDATRQIEAMRGNIERMRAKVGSVQR